MTTLRKILDRIEVKKSDYERYGLSQVEYSAIMTFFDLAQEFDDIEDYYHLCIAIPKSFFNLDARLYIRNLQSNALQLLARTDTKDDNAQILSLDDRWLSEGHYYINGSLILPVRGKYFLVDQLPFHAQDNVLGFLELYPVENRDEHTELFFEKYANRIGFSLHNKFLAEKNIEHLKFIRTLVADIEHNVIVPNIIYKLFLRRLRGKIAKNIEIENLLSEESNQTPDVKTAIQGLLKEMKEVNKGLTEELENIEKHYKNMSLFLETLFRRDHFDQGKLTLRTKACHMKRDVVQPQLERYMEQFQKSGIAIDDRLSGIPDEDIISVVDIGLIAQVYANFFSNALKYTQEIITASGQHKKYISYGREFIRDFFGPGRNGIKYNVFSTGPHIPPDEQGIIYEEGYRAKDALSKPGTGHGLAFAKNAVEIHGGIVGYEPTQYGNNFYFIIPQSDEIDQS
ncbi:MAG TPA: HAMP domain-containing sensor histidine kinase [Desulfatiglandales bacterium]|nr:HAMP domain-containing sensor histidine kinase [Desulfatiglandales bacterium]